MTNISSSPSALPDSMGTLPVTGGSVTSARSSSTRRLAFSALAGGMAQAVYLATRLLLAPVVIAAVGFEGYGLWAVLFLVLGLLGVHRMGFTSVVMTYVARFTAEGRYQEVEKTARSAASVMVLLGIGLGIPLLLAAPAIVEFLGASGSLVQEAALTLRVTVAGTFLGMVLGGYQSILEGLKQFPVVRAVESTAGLIEGVLILVLLQAGWGMPGLAMAYVARVLLPIPVFVFLVRKHLPGVSALPGILDRGSLGRLIRFGGAVQLLGVVLLATESMDRILLGQFASLAAVGILEAGRKLISTTGGLAGAAMAPLIPEAASTDVEDPKQLSALLSRTTSLVAFGCGLVLGFLGLFAPDIIAVWLGNDQGQVAMVLQLLALPALIHLCTGPTTAVLRGLARPRAELAYSVLWLVLGLSSIPVCTRLFGIQGAVLAAGGSQAIASIYLLVRSRAQLALPWQSLYAEICVPALCAALPMLLLSGVVDLEGLHGQRLALLLGLLLVGFLGTLLSVALAFKVLLTAGQRAHLLGSIQSTFFSRFHSSGVDQCAH